MEPIRDLAIVLRSIPFEERHRVVTALTQKHGRISAVARNSIQSRRFGGTLEVFSTSEWLFTRRPGAELYQLTEAHIREPFDGLRKDFEKLSLASVFSELMTKIAPESEVCLELFLLHFNALTALNTRVEAGIEVSLLNVYLAKILQWSGSPPYLKDCLSCGALIDTFPDSTEFSCIIADAGWICPECRHTQTRHIQEREGVSFQHSFLKLTPRLIREFYLSLGTPIRKFSNQSQATDLEHRELFKFLEAVLMYHVPGFDYKQLKALRFLNLER